ncbi:MAG: flagellar hook-length control protein FliK, partial [Pseudomonadota bacterium]
LSALAADPPLKTGHGEEQGSPIPPARWLRDLVAAEPSQPAQTETGRPAQAVETQGQPPPPIPPTRWLRKLVAAEFGTPVEIKTNTPVETETHEEPKSLLAPAALLLQGLGMADANPSAKVVVGEGSVASLGPADLLRGIVAARAGIPAKTAGSEASGTPLASLVALPGNASPNGDASDAPMRDSGERAGSRFFDSLLRAQEPDAGQPDTATNPAFSTISTQLPGVGDPATSPRAIAQLPSLPTPLGSPGWAQGVGERVQWMVGERIQQAELHINPPELGPVEIKISLQNDQAQVTFLAHHGATREALEAALPKLKEMLGQDHIQLSHAEVGQRDNTSGQQAARDSQGGHGHGGSGRGGGNGYGTPETPVETPQTHRPANFRRLESRLVDDFA